MPRSRAAASGWSRRASEMATCAISGAVGTFANIDPRVEEYVAAKLGLTPEPVSTQIIPRDRHAQFFATLGVIAGSIENLAIEIRHLQRSEVREAEEYFSPGPEGLLGDAAQAQSRCCRRISPACPALIRSAVAPALENIALWHERDISHSSVERVIAPDATIALDFALGAPDRPDREARGLSRRPCSAISTRSAAWCIPSGCCWR